MILRSLASIEGTARDIRSGTGKWRSMRLALAEDGSGVSFSVTTVYAGTVTEMHYRNHVETVFILEGEAVLTNHETNETHPIRGGDLYILDKHERHSVHAITLLKAISIFSPPLTGAEDHDDSGSYPAS
ncbi:ectoine synthase [Agrobacterium tumefaciens]|uniref:ectoine synthase n=1 Tax=Agrobacterium tumefaciens TaxID=358 RepID=UPI0022441199|nr:ectoine synthase [Agrobacterium tumefaciens]MCW8060098.1 ectoine synthase [Agrobacterium tumefaciens]